jgi:nucleotide-binding universal stress UspA family protein
MNETPTPAPAGRSIHRILLGASDSPAGFAAARLAVELAVACGATVRAIHVLSDGELSAALSAASAEARTGGPATLIERREHGGSAVLRHVVTLADRSHVPIETVQLWGEPASCLLAEANRWTADLIVLGQGGAPGRRQPYLGAEVRRVLEFAEQPVLVAPPG